MAKPTKEQLARINSLVFGRKLEDEEVEVLQFSIFDTEETYYHTVFDPRTLAKYRKDLAEGKVALIELHKGSSLPHGRSFEGRLSDKLSGQFYVPLKDVRGEFRKERVDFVSGIYDGTTFDVSGGIHATRYECNICGNDVRTFDCKHWPGQTFNVAKENEQPKMVKCVAYVKGTKTATDPVFGEYFVDVGMSELSGVIDGAVESAHPQPVTYEKGEGDEVVGMTFGGLEFKKGELGEQVLKFEKTPLRVKVHGVEADDGGQATGHSTEVKNVEGHLEETADQVLGKLLEKTEECVGLKAQLTETHGKLTAALTQVTALEGSLAKAKPASDRLVELVLENGVRLHGNAYPLETERSRLQACTAEELVAFHKETTEAVRAKYPHGRQTPGVGGDKKVVPLYPDHVFKAS